ncbi:TPA: hypothetical protein MIG81_25270 [Klebsiella pneumoniae]|nr:hypothetical protein [Klebsiella pneumoniae]HBX7904856.1 hypothetical protein [Klebsiella pneumoniae]HBX7927144.1 hypothetical protein [Klebsiella pneumoniae]HBX7931272.1 hypothetical protein [Klebsiella pneumoniae]HBY1803953.1 hypothetical protein [Klebsiella pneumoniae]
MRDSSHQYVVLPEKFWVKYRNRPLKNQAITHPDKGRAPGVYFIRMKNASMHAPAFRSSSPNAHLFLSGWRTKTL